MKKLLYLTTAALALCATTTYANDSIENKVNEPTFEDLLVHQDQEIGVSRVVIDQEGHLVKLDKQNIHVNIKKGEKGFVIVNTGRNEYKLEVQEKDGKAVLLSTPQLLHNLSIKPVKNGWVKTDYGKWQYYRHGEALPAGWANLEGKWYFFDPSHDMKNGGWEFINGKWYYLSESGAMLTGWQHLDGHWYYLNTLGAMETGWVKDNGTWYYLDKSGVMKSNTWFKVGDKWYFAKYSGALAVNTTIDGYHVNENGEWV